MNYNMTFGFISGLIQGRVTLLVGVTLGVTTNIVTFFVRNLVQRLVFRNHSLLSFLILARFAELGDQSELYRSVGGCFPLFLLLRRLKNSQLRALAGAPIDFRA